MAPAFWHSACQTNESDLREMAVLTISQAIRREINPGPGVIYRIKGSVCGQSECSVTVEEWIPYSCQGRSWNTLVLESLPYQGIFCKYFNRYIGSSPQSLEVDEKNHVTWIRGDTITENSTINSMRIAKGFDILFDVVQTSGIDQIEIGPLGHDWASQILYWKLMNNPKITRLEFRNDFYDIENVAVEMRRIMNLCCKLIRTSSSIKEILFENLQVYDIYLIQQLFESLQYNSSINKIDLRRCRYIDSWNKERKIRRSETENKNLASIDPIVSALTSGDSKFSLTTLNLSGNVFSRFSMHNLAVELPQLNVETLMLRDTCLQEDALLRLVKSLKYDTMLKKIDLSHNKFSMHIMEQLCKSLKNNKTLESLTIEHCEITLNQVQCLASSFPAMKGIRHLFMDGNDFTWTPLSPQKDGEKMYSVGAKMLVDALENNYSLQSLTVGQFEIGSFCRLCCTPQNYTELLDCKTKNTKFQKFLHRNKDIYAEYRRTKMQESIINIARLLLSKLEA